MFIVCVILQRLRILCSISNLCFHSLDLLIALVAEAILRVVVFIEFDSKPAGVNVLLYFLVGGFPF